jgi:general stress protein CsbA
MKSEQKYIKDLTEIRSMMERSTKFLSLTGWSGIMAGIYALTGASIAYKLFYFNPDAISYETLDKQAISGNFSNLFLLATGILVLAIGTAILLSQRKSRKSGERLWNSAARRLVTNMAIPLFTGGVFILILFSKGLLGLIAPLTLIFYGLALINASKFTYEEVKYLGLIEIALGLIASYFIGYGLLFWAIGFGVMHIIYGIYMHLRYEK